MSARPAIELAVTALAELFKRELSPGALKLYVAALNGIPPEIVIAALEVAAVECKFFPLPFEIRQLAGVRSDDEHAVEAWAEVLDSISLGPYKWVEFDDGTINATIRNLGGWPTFLARFTDAAAEKWARQEFVKTYASLRNSGSVAGVLTGLSEKEVDGGNVIDPRPIRIGTNRPDVLTITDQSKRADVPRVEFKSTSEN
jgi:hypothetical protein